jgi:hypothetical protein
MWISKRGGEFDLSNGAMGAVVHEVIPTIKLSEARRTEWGQLDQCRANQDIAEMEPIEAIASVLRETVLLGREPARSGVEQEVQGPLLKIQRRVIRREEGERERKVPVDGAVVSGASWSDEVRGTLCRKHLSIDQKERGSEGRKPVEW